VVSETNCAEGQTGGQRRSPDYAFLSCTLSIEHPDPTLVQV